MSENAYFLEDCHKLIAAGETSAALNKLKSANFPQFKNQVTILSNRWEELCRQKSLSVISQSEYELERNKINLDLVNLISSIENKEHPSRVSSKQNSKKKLIFGIVSVLALAFITFSYYNFSRIDSAKITLPVNVGLLSNGESLEQSTSSQNDNSTEQFQPEPTESITDANTVLDSHNNALLNAKNQCASNFPEDVGTMYLLRRGKCLTEAGFLDEAIAICQTAVEKSTTPNEKANCYYAMGVCYDEADIPNKALEFYRIAYDIHKIRKYQLLIEKLENQAMAEK